MKNIKNILIIFVFALALVFSFSGCSEKEKIVESSVEAMTLCELEQIDGIENFSDETIKALSVIIRTNNKNDNETNFAYIPNNKRIEKLVEETNGKILVQKNNEDLNENNIASPIFIGTLNENNQIKNNKLDYINSEGSKTWSVVIKKSAILNYLKKNNISLSNISDIKTNNDNDGKLLSISIGNKEIPYSSLKENFGIKSNKILKIENNLTNIVIYGEYDESFDIYKAENLSSQGNTYDKILNVLVKNYEIY